ncbi:MAG: hypothetical protein ACOZNI_32375 [Myxococcota bacterium]
MILLAFAGCEAPGLLQPLVDELSDELVAEASPGIRLFVGVTGVVAATCAVEDLVDDPLAGEAVEALGLVGEKFAKDADSGELTWVEDAVGVDGAEGTLELSADSARETWQAEYERLGVETLAATLALDCGDDGDAVVSGGGTYTTAEGKHSLTLVGDAPVTGVWYEDATALAPDEGQLRWARDEDDLALLLDDASEIADGKWPGTASGPDWEDDEVEVDLP